jgi:hypothetical protein
LTVFPVMLTPSQPTASILDHIVGEDDLLAGALDAQSRALATPDVVGVHQHVHRSTVRPLEDSLMALARAP